jgi:adenylyltransferase/sulfurtransferase
MTIIPGKSPCLRCIFPKGVTRQGDGSSVPVIGPTPGVLGAMQAMEVAKYLLGQQVCSDGIVTYNGLELSLEKVKIKPNPSCICAL